MGFLRWLVCLERNDPSKMTGNGCSEGLLKLLSYEKLFCYFLKTTLMRIPFYCGA